ncbi:hypothetical protein AVEN_206194-1, partial [Araneus ventricosus]
MDTLNPEKPRCHAFWIGGSRLEIRYHWKSTVHVGLVYMKFEVVGQTSSRWCGQSTVTSRKHRELIGRSSSRR